MTGLLTGSPSAGTPDGPGRQHDLVVVSHRGPVQFTRTAGRRAMRRNAGGLVTALHDASRHVERTRWICASASAEDREVARATPWLSVDGCDVHMLDLERTAHRAFYGVIANPLLWFVQHRLPLHAPAGPREIAAWHNGYVPVNAAFARALCDPAAVPPRSIVMVHDYHLYLVPEMVRTRRSDLLLHFFTHIPWPAPDAWSALPQPMRDAVFTGVLGSDIAGFQTVRDATDFLLGCRDLLGLPVDFRHGSVTFRGREVAVRHYPISVDAGALRAQARADAVGAHRRALRHAHTGRLVVRVDRTDPSKNIVRGFEAFALLLRDRPELRSDVTFLALLQPSRQDVPEYAAYRSCIEQTVTAVNSRFGTSAWRPIDCRFGDDLSLALAAYAEYDALLVNSVADGMNLVAKEAVLLNERDGALALSMLAGAHDELAATTVSLDPFDVAQQAHGLYEALTMPRAARKARREVAAQIVESNDLEKWLARQFADIELMQLARTCVS